MSLKTYLDKVQNILHSLSISNKCELRGEKKTDRFGRRKQCEPDPLELFTGSFNQVKQINLSPFFLLPPGEGWGGGTRGLFAHKEF